MATRWQPLFPTQSLAYKSRAPSILSSNRLVFPSGKQQKPTMADEKRKKGQWVMQRTPRKTGELDLGQHRQKYFQKSYHRLSGERTLLLSLLSTQEHKQEHVMVSMMQHHCCLRTHSFCSHCPQEGMTSRVCFPYLSRTVVPRVQTMHFNSSCKRAKEGVREEKQITGISAFPARGRQCPQHSL